MKPRLPTFIASCAALTALACAAEAQEPPKAPPKAQPQEVPPAKPAQDAPKAVPGAQALPDFVAYPAGKVTVGVEKSELAKFLEKQHAGKWQHDFKDKKAEWDRVWNVLLLQTPAHKQDVAAFQLAKYELTNAQWEVFLRHRIKTETLAEETSLEEFAVRVWKLNPDAGGDIQRGWKSILAQNANTLRPILNPSNDAKWDPLVARAQSQKLPKGTRVDYFQYIPPTHWLSGQLPDKERRMPMRSVSWEQAMDFCGWAGLHLPTEAEWERAARGDLGQLFPWGDEWDPLKAIWLGYNMAARAAKNPDFQPVGGEEAPRETPHPVEVDRHAAGANKEGVLHLVGNVREFTLEPIRLYEGSESKFSHAGQCVLAKGGFYAEQHPELVTAFDRHFESVGGGPFLADHVDEGQGVRLAAYPNPGADLAAAAACVWHDDMTADDPWKWMPTPPGLARDKARPFLRFDPANSAGILTRQTSADARDFAYVTGPCTGLSFLPVRGFPGSQVKTPSDLSTPDPDNPLLIGVLVGSETMSVTLTQPGGKKVNVSLADNMFSLAPGEVSRRAAQGRRFTRAPLGAMLVLSGSQVLVYAPSASVNSKAKYRPAPLGSFPDVKVQMVPADTQPSAVRSADGKEVALSAVVPLLDDKGRANKSFTKKFQITITVPLAGAGEAPSDRQQAPQEEKSKKPAPGAKPK